MGIRRSGGSVPAGTIIPFAGGTLPAGHLFCAGQAVSRATYAALFLAIGTVYGAGDGATTFNLPDLRGRGLFGKDNMGGTAANRLTTAAGGVDGVTLGAAGGGQSVTLTQTEMPNHNHNVDRYSTLALQSGSVTNCWANTATVASSATGGSGAHKNMPPAMVANFIIKT